MKCVKLRTLIVEDEPLAREKIRSFLQDYSDFEVIGECENGEEAGQAILAQGPQVVFLDVEIPGKNGLELLHSLPRDSQPAIVVVTAFDQYAVRAFEVEAVDYLLKPFNKTRFAQAIKRLRQDAAGCNREKGAALNGDPDAKRRKTPNYERLSFKSGSKIMVVRSTWIEWIEAQGDYVMVHAQKSSHLVRETMSAMEKRLDPRRFARIHRSVIVNLDCIRELRPLWSGDYRVCLHNGTELTLSRNYRSAVRDNLQV
ncbi:MAG TPA: LytTR family DNA-binding domain-containing protein [Candidatus Angelobacter sp.]